VRTLSGVSAAVVELKDVTKNYGAVHALDGVSFSIEPGEVVAMLGPNGAGKTTSISIMLGTRRPSAGTARLFGLDPRDLKARSRIGVMLQESGVPGMLRVRELIDLFASYYPSPLPVAESVGIAGLEEKASALIKDLSGGQRQRLYLALAICGNPDVLFLDEPTVGMDVEGRRNFLSEISDYAARGRTVVMTTHYLEEADQLAKRVIVIDHGKVIADSTPAQIKARVAGKHVVFTPSRPLTDADVEGLPLTGKNLTDHSVRLLTNDPETVLQELWRRGVVLTNLEVGGADLEEAFLAMTHHETQV
jgi:ABC-2 type transport system ATP-binding protein